MSAAAQSWLDQRLLTAMEAVRETCRLGHAARQQCGVKVRQPLPRLMLDIEATRRIWPYFKTATEIIAQELNVKQVVFTADDGQRFVHADGRA